MVAAIKSKKLFSLGLGFSRTSFRSGKVEMQVEDQIEPMDLF